MPAVTWSNEPVSWGAVPAYWGAAPVAPAQVSDGQPVYQVFVVDRDDEVLDVLAPCVVDHWEHTLKGVSEAELVVPLDAHGLSELRTLEGRPAIGYPWLRIHRDGAVVFRGFPDDWRFDLKGGCVVLGLKCMMGHLDHLVFGDAERVNYLTNPGAEEGAHDWTGVDGCIVETTTDSVRGGTALKLTGFGGTSYAHQRVTLPAEAVFRHGWYLSVWVKVPAGNHWPAGLSVVRYYNGVQFPARAFWADPPDDFVYDRWVKLDLGPVGADPGIVVEFDVRLSAYSGEVVLYDEVRLSRTDATTATPGSDVATMVSTMFATAQTMGDLGYTRSVTPTGEVLDQGHVYLHSEHAGILGALNDWDHVVDWRYRPADNVVQIGPPSSVGTERTDIVMGDMGMVPTDLGVGSQGVVSEGISLGDADVAVTREEGGYRDSTAGFRWMQVERAAARATLKDLDRQAIDMVVQGIGPLQQVAAQVPLPPDGRCPGDWLTRGFDVGDRIMYQQTVGPFELASLQQVTALTVHPMQGDALEVQLVEFRAEAVS